MSLWSRLAERFVRVRAPAAPPPVPTDPITLAVNAALPVIKEFEGCRLTAYRCPAGVWTIGWGATGDNIVEGLTWTQQQADVRLAVDARQFAIAVRRAVTVALTPNQHGACASLAYNIGAGAFGASTLVKMLNAGDYAGAADQFGRWTKAKGVDLPGLVRRRDAERDLFVKE